MLRHIILTLVALFFGASSTRADFVYNDFSSTSGLHLNGNATTGAVAPASGTVLKLTAPNFFQAGSAFTTNLTPLSNQASFSTYFQFQMPNAGGIGDEDGAGADGIVFVVQTVSNNVGASGGGIGYQGIGHSLGIEIDTYNNGAPGDLDGNHVGVDLNGDINSVVQAHEPTRFNNGQIWNMWVDYNGTTDALDINWSQSTSRPALPQLAFSLQPYGGLVGVLGQSSAYVGFTAATGSGYEDQDIVDWQFRQEFNPIGAPEPGTFTLVGVGILGLCGSAWRRRKSAAA